MLRHQNIDRICSVIIALTLLTACCYVGAGAAGMIETETSLGYESRLFDQGRVHTIDIIMDDWDAFIADATSETYYDCTMVIDGEKYGNVAIRGKGNTSLSNVAAYGNDRYSFKVEFDHYQAANTYHGLDKLSLNNLIQDATYMKDYLAYTLMGKMGVASPLCSFVQLNVNGEAWGLYLAVEGVEDAFLTRNFGSDHGELYKPDSMSFGGGRGNGRDFDIEAFTERFDQPIESQDAPKEGTQWQPGDFLSFGGGQTAPDSMNPLAGMQGPGVPQMEAGMNERQTDGIGMGASDVLLRYTDDDPASYSNIFDNAKTDVNDIDKARLIAALKVLNDPETAANAVDVGAVIRYFAVHHFLCNDDSYTGSMIHNYYLYEEDGVLSMIPWDYNLAFGGFGMGGGMGKSEANGATGTVNSPIDSPVSSGDVAQRPMLAWIFADESYTAQYHETYAQLIADCFESGWFAEEVDRVTAMISPYVEKDVNGFYDYDEFRHAAATLREFCLLRAKSITGQLDGSIPSTDTAQRANSSALIDASYLNVSDMGGMEGNAQDERGMSFGHDGAAASAPDAGSPEGMQRPEGMERPEGMGRPENVESPEGAGASVNDKKIPTSRNINAAAGTDAALLLCISAAMLLVGLVIACRFRNGR